MPQIIGGGLERLREFGGLQPSAAAARAANVGALGEPPAEVVQLRGSGYRQALGAHEEQRHLGQHGEAFLHLLQKRAIHHVGQRGRLDLPRHEADRLAGNRPPTVMLWGLHVKGIVRYHRVLEGRSPIGAPASPARRPAPRPQRPAEALRGPKKCLWPG